MNKALSVMTELSRLPISTQRRFIHEIARELLQEKIPLHSSILPRYNELNHNEKRTFYFVLMEYMEKDDVGKTLIK
ncbi:TPA: hypothetical protein ACPJ9D_000869 [Haemophilus influenzae]|jgi:hypothetical protein|uniref:Uncharacterized protein n=1 Tax=Haemophilus influenzae TaxID=727 RepID=A0A2S9S687_HAEIF|nr:hypothetical protein [Haemophilus influenzae]AXP39619.1 hypothetical protein CH628_04720 [Haemophilus influenzae]MCK8905628.1 hypothetical protein [Haemophilus influenzae]MCK8944438.1 hypothetical protein [Haemophilus influenzae]MCK8969733.1 hypothetical protein [Haemophilus influenzae]MCK8974939.1 hypothetical protein [Haemophilus influenzae]